MSLGSKATTHWSESSIDSVALVEFGTRVTKRLHAGTLYPVYGGGGATFSLDEYNRENCCIVSRFGMSEECVRHVEGKFFLNDSGLTVRTRDEDRLAQKFLDTYLLGSQARIYDLGRGAAQKNLNVEAFRQLVVPLPPLHEQRRIVAKLDQAFAALDRARANAEANLADTYSIEQRVLDVEVDLLFGKFGGVSVGEIASVKGGKRLPKGEKLQSLKTPFPYITVGDMNDEGSVDLESLRFMPSQVQRTIRNYTISKSDVYISIAGSIGKTGIVPDELDGANLTENAAKLVLLDDWDKHYVYWNTRSSSFKQQAIDQTRVTAQPKLALQRIEEISIPRADKADQKRLVELMRRIRTEVAKAKDAYQSKVDDIAAIRQSLLQAAFSGQLT